MEVGFSHPSPTIFQDIENKGKNRLVVGDPGDA